MSDTLDVGLIDPNLAPPTRPPSALSTNSDTSYFALYEESESEQVDPDNRPPEYLPRRIVVETIRRHGWECLLCGRGDDLTVVRAVLQHENEGASEDPISWLKSFGLLPPGYERDDWTNLMTLCGLHARAYDEGVWRWVPCAKYRRQMFSALPARANALENGDGDVTMTDDIADETSKEFDDSSLSPISPSDAGVPAETLVDDGISGTTRKTEIRFQPMETPQFDVLVFRPESMPAVPNALSKSSAAVWREWRTLILNPYVAYASSLEVIGVADSASQDVLLQGVSKECLDIRSRWEAVAA
ncbi:hypothetical protein BD309DRAFT_958876 [Dichomitus squalens]|uniref:Uncharacterized protein n=1 Tax=Dichomitus squalens TaxID=114155 RepID=A0A4Q9NU21_9APHY|nr:hypothetical protein BD309DRAFT_958876 [Dichomitus squalens]TBU60119.1 hypothetical protein BD310DRAFT_923372 [Dichomitus squalens]